MGRLIKNHWARLITLSAASCKWKSPPPPSHRQIPAEKERKRKKNHAKRGSVKANNVTPDQIAAALEGFFWPKIFWDFLTKALDPAVKPVPALQTINLLMGLGMLAWDWPLPWVAGTSVHRSLEARLAVLPLVALASVMLYQGTNPAIYYLVAMVVYFWAYSEGEVVCAKPWTLPQRGARTGKV